jgi:hypothetical protein
MSAKRFFNKMGQGAKRFFNKDVGANAQKLFSKGGQAEQIGKKALGITDDVLRVGGQIVKGIGQASNQLAPVLGPEFKGLGGVINKIGKASGQVGNALDKAANIKKNVIQAVKKPSPPSMNEMQPLLEPDLINFG